MVNNDEKEPGSEYDVVNVAKLIRHPSSDDGTAQLSENERYEAEMGHILSLAPTVSPEDLEVLSEFESAMGLLHRLAADLHRSLVDLLEPFGLISPGATSGEAVNAIPKDWSERETIDDVVAVLTTVASALDTFDELWSDSPER